MYDTCSPCSVLCFLKQLSHSARFTIHLSIRLLLSSRNLIISLFWPTISSVIMVIGKESWHKCKDLRFEQLATQPDCVSNLYLYSHAKTSHDRHYTNLWPLIFILYPLFCFTSTSATYVMSYLPASASFALAS